MSEWYYMKSNQPTGPYSLEKMMEMKAGGIIDDGTVVRHVDGKKWSYLRDSKLSNEIASTTEDASEYGRSIPGHVKGVFLNATEKVNEMVGETGNIDLKLKDVFSSVFKKHTKDQAETLFISGTRMTTPNEAEISTSWPKPWLFARIFIVFAITYLLLYVSTFVFQNDNAIPGLIVIGAFAVPFSLLIFFWETNVPRNISIYEIAKLFFIGGAASLVATLFLYSIFPVYELSYTGAIMIGIIEEIGKLIIVAYFINQTKVKFILNGLLIGAAIGAGFAAFETAGYAFNFGMVYGEQVMLKTIVARAWLSIGGHVVWAAITGAALVYVKGNHEKLKSDHFLDGKFIKLFLVPVTLHAIWDMPFFTLEQFYIKFILLIIVAWIFIFTLINAGLQQITRLNQTE